MIQLTNHKDGVVLPVRAYPNARKNEIRGEQDGALKVAVTQAPKQGKANKAIIAFLAKSMGLRKSQLRIVSGLTSNQKRVLASGITLEELKQLLIRHS